MRYKETLTVHFCINTTNLASQSVYAFTLAITCSSRAFCLLWPIGEIMCVIRNGLSYSNEVTCQFKCTCRTDTVKEEKASHKNLIIYFHVLLTEEGNNAITQVTKCFVKIVSKGKV